MESYGEFRERSRATIWTSLSNLMTIFIVLVVIAGAMAMLLPELPRGRAQRSDADALTLKVAEQKKLLARQKQQVHWLQTNPEYLEIFARDRLEMMKAGETVFRLEGETK